MGKQQQQTDNDYVLIRRHTSSKKWDVVFSSEFDNSRKPEYAAKLVLRDFGYIPYLEWVAIGWVYRAIRASSITSYDVTDSGGSNTSNRNCVAVSTMLETDLYTQLKQLATEQNQSIKSLIKTAIVNLLSDSKSDYKIDNHEVENPTIPTFQINWRHQIPDDIDINDLKKIA